MFTISIGKANATCPDKVTLTSGMVKAVQVVFNFSEEWDGFSKIAIFSNGATTLDVSLDDENKCYIPHEVLTTAGKEVSVGIYGCKGEGDDYVAIPTVKCSLGKVLTGADPSGEEPAEPTPTMLDELIIRVADVENDVKEIENAIFKSVDLTKCTTEANGEITEDTIKPKNSVGASGTIYVSGYCEIEVENAGIGYVTLHINSESYNAISTADDDIDYKKQRISFKGEVNEPITFSIESSSIAKFTKFFTTSDYSLNKRVLEVETNKANKVDVDEGFKGTFKRKTIHDREIFSVADDNNTMFNYSVYNPNEFVSDESQTVPPFIGAKVFVVSRGGGSGHTQYAFALNGDMYFRHLPSRAYEDENNLIPWKKVGEDDLKEVESRIINLLNIKNSVGVDSLRQAPKTEEWIPGNQKIIDFLNANKEKYSAYFDENGNVVIKEGAFGDWSTALSGYGHAGAQHSVVNNRRVIILPEAIGAHGEGNENLIAAIYGHAEGSFNVIGEKAEKSHIEGYGNVTYAPVSHVGGQYNTVEETASFADVTGVGHNVSGTKAFVRGTGHNVSGDSDTVLGWKHRVSGKYQTVLGKKNVDDPTKAVIVGGGNENQPDDLARRNIYTLDWSGNGYFAGDVTFTYGGKEYKASDLLSRIAALEEKVKNL